jgi:hypothetical protein
MEREGRTIRPSEVQMRTCLLILVVVLGACSSSGAGGAGGSGGSAGAGGSGGHGGAGGSGGTGGSGGSGEAGSGGTGPTTGGSSRYFPAGGWFTDDVRTRSPRPDSQAITSWMEAHSGPNGWGTGEMRIDFSFSVVDAPAHTAKKRFTTVTDFHADPDCDDAPVPLPDGGAVEQYPAPASLNGLAGYECPGFDAGEDCHILVFSPSEDRLYELYHATVHGDGSFEAGCLALWSTSAPLRDGRGEQCTSADGAGFPIAPMLFRPQDIRDGHIDHAIRFIVPNDMIQASQYVHPASHGTRTSGPSTSAPYGALFRLRADYPLDRLSPGAQVIARAMMTYGMYISDGGNIALTAESDALSPVKWDDVGVDARSLIALKATDFEVIDAGPSYDVTFDCKRTPIVE